MNQEEIIFKLKQGDNAVFSEVILARQDMVYNTALSIVQNEEDAEDITQEVFVTMYEKIKKFREESTLSTWLYKITISKALDVEKKKKRLKHGGLIKKYFKLNEEEEPVNFNHPGILLDNKEKAAILFQALKKIPDKQRIAFTLHKIEGLSYQQIASVMDISLQAIESLQLRAKKNLQEILKEHYNQL